MCSTNDFSQWQDHGPILVGPADGYELALWGNHPQGQLESSYLMRKNEKWILLVQENRRGTNVRNWIYESDRMDWFDYSSGR